MSFSNHKDTILVSNCPYHCTCKFYTTISNQTDIRNLCNNEIQQNWQGQMCGKCAKNFAPSPYSYTFDCAYCSKYNWVKYLAIIYLPLTLLYILVIFFRFNAMSASMSSLILICQLFGCPAAMSIFNTYAKFCNMDLEIEL